MQLEVEQKYPVADAKGIETLLTGLGAKPLASVTQTDTYYNHPSRDFAVTDEAIRLRKVGNQAFLTYKGPKFDPTTKSRREIELPLVSPEGWSELFKALGFKEVATVRKRREGWQLERSPFSVEVCLDRVEQVGLFAEIEIVADDNQLEPAKQVLAELADKLRLEKPERRSYLEMLLENIM